MFCLLPPLRWVRGRIIATHCNREPAQHISQTFCFVCGRDSGLHTGCSTSPGGIANLKKGDIKIFQFQCHPATVRFGRWHLMPIEPFANVGAVHGSGYCIIAIVNRHLCFYRRQFFTPSPAWSISMAGLDKGLVEFDRCFKNPQASMLLTSSTCGDVLRMLSEVPQNTDAGSIGQSHFLAVVYATR